MKSCYYFFTALITLSSCSFDSKGEPKKYLVLDSQIKDIVPKYQPFGGDSFSYLVFESVFDLKAISVENATHIKTDGSNVEYQKDSDTYKIFRSENSWTNNKLAKNGDEYIPNRHLTSCRKSFGTGEVLCVFKLNSDNKGYQFTLDEKNMELADEIFVALQILTKK